MKTVFFTPPRNFGLTWFFLKTSGGFFRERSARIDNLRLPPPALEARIDCAEGHADTELLRALATVILVDRREHKYQVCQ